MWRFWTATTSGTLTRLQPRSRLEAFPGIGLLFSDYIGFDTRTGQTARGGSRLCGRRHRPAAPLLHPWRSDPAVLRCAEPQSDRGRGPVRPVHALQRGRGILAARRGGGAASSPGVALVRKREWYGSLGSAKYALENLACKREITRRMLRRVPDWRRQRPRARRGSRTRPRSTSCLGRSRAARDGVTCAGA
jgi:hypothetical protein